MLSKFKKTTEKILSAIFLCACVLFILFGIYMLVLDIYYKDRYYPRTKMFGYDVSGKMRKDVNNEFFQKLSRFSEDITFTSNNFSKSFKADDLGLKINLYNSLNEGFYYGRDTLTLKSIKDRIMLLAFGNNTELDYNINGEVFENFLKNEIYPAGVTSKDISFEKINNDFEFIIGKNEKVVDRMKLTEDFKEKILALHDSTLNLPFLSVKSVISNNEWENTKKSIGRITSAPIYLKFKEKTWEINEDQLENWIVLEISDNKVGKTFKKKIEVGMDREKFHEFLKGIASDINIDPINARFQVINDKLELLEPSVLGRELLMDANFEKFENFILEEDRNVTLATKERGAKITQDNIDDLGIKDLIGTGESNFAGSPRNRIKNIEVAANKLNGVLLAPDETYSLVENIGEVSAAAGFFPELVIKENKTIPEYGGGLCQIATTIFRAAINTGLDITERQSHSYAVSYYKPHGMDATVYIPKPDLQFHNDTENHILIQAKINKYNLSFEFYGTEDGREVTIEGPSYWDRKPDGAFKSKFSQIVKMPDGSERKDQFISFYDSPDKYH
jgi:vancomycin resistance protein YoaR